jgi:hypothetical protein
MSKVTFPTPSFIVRNRRTELFALPTTTPNRFIAVEVRYSQGGLSYSDYKVKPRGYAVAAQAVTREPRREGEHFVCSGYTPSNGVCLHLEDATRYGDAKLIKIAREVVNNPELLGLIAQAAGNENLTLEGEIGEAVNGLARQAAQDRLAESYAVQAKQLDHYCKQLTPEQAQELRRRVAALNEQNQARTWEQVARGVAIERIAWELRGKTKEEYAAYLASMD